nr:MAG TPA: hypothetical protein [Caudoviricetes sp.]DAW78795.1 MAG TPA: hypothetical protein [Caudoviricetes sp.]
MDLLNENMSVSCFPMLLLAHTRTKYTKCN